MLLARGFLLSKGGDMVNHGFEQVRQKGSHIIRQSGLPRSLFETD
jgi:hypothetical protein